MCGFLKTAFNVLRPGGLEGVIAKNTVGRIGGDTGKFLSGAMSPASAFDDVAGPAQLFGKSQDSKSQFGDSWSRVFG